MIFTHESIELCSFEPGDYRLLHQWLKQDEIAEFLSTENNLTLEDVKALFPRNHWKSPFMIVYKAQRLGFVYLEGFTENQNIRHMLAPEAKTLSLDIAIGELSAQNQGLGQKTLAAVVAMVQQKFQADYLVLDTLTWNIKAIKCFEKSGFTQLAILKNHEFRKGAWVDNLLFGMDLNKRTGS